MFYKNRRYLFLFEIVVGLISGVSVLTAGKTGIALIALLIFRPFLFKQDHGTPGETIHTLEGKIFRISGVFLGIFLIGLYTGRELGALGQTENLVLLVLILPAYMVIHGVTGFVISRGHR